MSWVPVDGADYFRVGWIAAPDYQADSDDWREQFVFTNVSGKTTYTVTRLTPGEYYYFVVGSATERYGQAQWLGWVGVALNPAGNPYRRPGESADYDLDDDRLIEIATLAQLDAVRHDLNGLGASEHPDYLSAFPDAVVGMGCPPAGCVGYELAADLDMDTDGNGQAGLGDDYWNDGAGWEPIGTKQQPFDADFHGNGYTISNLYIVRLQQHIGLFGYIGPAGVVQRVGLEGGAVSGYWDVGALAGWNAGTIKGSYTTGLAVAGRYAAGGLVGWNGGTIVSSSTGEGTVLAVVNNGGGLVAGTESNSVILSSHSNAVIDGGKNLGGLVGEYRGGRISNSYATGNVHGIERLGGLIGNVNARGGDDFGWNEDEIVNVYATGLVSGLTDTGGLVGLNALHRVTIRDSYWDTDTSGLAASRGGTGKTTTELKTPTDNLGIYAAWGREWWDFGGTNQYPVLRSSGRDIALQQR